MAFTAQLDALTSRFFKKDYWVGIINGAGHADGAKRYTMEELRSRYDVLERNPVVNEANRAIVVETIRSIAEFMIWGDQQEPRIFDFLMENNIMVYLHHVLQQSQNRSGDVAKQVLQTLSIIVQNIKSEKGIFFLFSNNHINNIVETSFDFEDEEVLGFYITFLKAISLKLNTQTAQFFLILPNETPNSQPRLPLYTEAIKLAHHKEGMVRAGVRTLTLGVYSVHDPVIKQVITSPAAAQYFVAVSQYISDQIEVLAQELSDTQDNYSQQALSSLDSRMAEMEDMLSYCCDILITAQGHVSQLFARTLWHTLITQHLLQPLLPGHVTGNAQQAVCLYVLERMFCLVTYQPLLNNLALALLGEQDVSLLPCCRQSLVGLLQSAQPFSSSAATRLLAAIHACRSVSTDVRWTLGLGILQQPSSVTAEHARQFGWGLVTPAALQSTSSSKHTDSVHLQYWDVWDDFMPVSSTQVINSDALDAPYPTDLDSVTNEDEIHQVVDVVLQGLVNQAVDHATSSTGPVLCQQPCSHHNNHAVANRDIVAALFVVLGEMRCSTHTLYLCGYLLSHMLRQTSIAHTDNTADSTTTTLTLKADDRHQLTSALTKAAAAIGEQLEKCWPDAFFPLFQHEWAAAASGMSQPSLLPNADQMVSGEFSRSASLLTLEALGLGPTAVQALHLCHAVQHLTAVLHVCQSLQLFAPELPGPLAWMLSEMDRSWTEVIEGHQVGLSKANSVSCQVCFVPPDPIRVSLAVAGEASDVILRYSTNNQQANRIAQGVLAHSSPTVVLAQTANNCVDAGVVVSTAPLLGSKFYQDPKVAVWMHVLVRPSVQSLIKQVKRAAQRRGGLLACLRNLSDGHWILQFKDGPRVLEALRLTDRSLSAAADVYKDVIGRRFISAWLSALMWSD